MTDKTQPEALRLAEMLTADEWPGSVTLVSYARECVAELRRQHARIEELEAQLEAVGAAPAVDIAAVGEMQAFEAWYKQDCVIAGDAAKTAAKAAWKARAMLAAEQQAAPKAAPGEQNTVPAEWLEQAYREGWAACRDAETIGEEAEDWAFGNSTANSRMIDAQQAAPQQEAQEPTAFIHWPINGPPRLVWYSQKALNDAILKTHEDSYKPDVKLYTAPQPAPDCHHRPPCAECASLTAQGGKQ